jgi:hypothetical protein
MRKEREPERKSAHSESRRKDPTPSVSPRRGELFAEIEIEDSVLVTPPGETSSTPRSGSSDLNPDRQDPDPEGVETGSEEDAMTRLKYKTFKIAKARTGSQELRKPDTKVLSENSVKYWTALGAALSIVTL